jgi:polyhydroxybutyrate depolymerase
MGGGMSNHVACFMSDVYAAVAPAGMDLNTTNSAKCNPERPISVIMFRGTNDNVCRYQGGDSGYGDGLNFLGAERNFKFWAEKNGCEGSPSKNSDGCQEYSKCKDGTKVVLCTKQGGGHEQGDGKIGWPFLKQFTLP